MAQKALTRAERNIAWIERHCRIPEGKDVGKPVRLRDWQKKDLKMIYDNPAGTRRAIISFGKKNAKTTLAAFLVVLHLAGPEAKRNTQIPSTAQSREQAAVLFELAAKVVRMSPTLSPVIAIRDTLKQLLCHELGTIYKALSADASTAHGLSPAVAIHDELGQVKGPRSELYSAIENAMGAHEEPLSIIISTQAARDGDLLSVLIDDALSGEDPRIVVSLYTAPMDMDPFSDEAIRMANPAAGDFLNFTELREQADSARRMPAAEPIYRQYTLNQRVETADRFVTESIWGLNDAPPVEGNIFYAGLDLSSTNDLTALVLVSPIGDTLSVFPHFWLPGDGLADRSRQDRVPYDTWKQQGYLFTTPGRAVEYSDVAAFLADMFQQKDIRKVAFDAWKWPQFRPWLIHAGMPESLIDERFVPFRQGYISMSPALRTLESLFLNAKLAHGNHPVLRMCAANAVVVSDAAGNRKLDKKKSTGRIDGMQALAMAAATAYEDMNQGHVFGVSMDSFIERVA